MQVRGDRAWIDTRDPRWIEVLRDRARVVAEQMRRTREAMDSDDDDPRWEPIC
jgi:hypothetical protein